MVILKGYNGKNLIETKEMSIDEFYDGDLDMIDNPAYLKKNGINKVIGMIYSDEKSDMESQFINYYDADGNIIGSDSYDKSLTLAESSRMCFNYDSIVERYVYNLSLSDDLLNIEFEINYKPEYNIDTNIIVCISDKIFELSHKETISNVNPKGANIFQKITSEFKVCDTKALVIKSVIDVYMGTICVQKIELTSGEIILHQ